MFAIHSATVDPEMAQGEREDLGRAVRVTDETTYARFVATFEAESSEDSGEVPQDFPLFTVDVEAVARPDRRAGRPPRDRVVECVLGLPACAVHVGHARPSRTGRWRMPV